MLSYTLYKESRILNQMSIWVWSGLRSHDSCNAWTAKLNWLRGFASFLISKPRRPPTLPSTNFLCVSLFHSTDPSNYKHMKIHLESQPHLMLNIQKNLLFAYETLFKTTSASLSSQHLSLPLHQCLHDISRLSCSISTPPGMSALAPSVLLVFNASWIYLNK